MGVNEALCIKGFESSGRVEKHYIRTSLEVCRLNNLSFILKDPPRQEDDMEVARAGQELNQEVNRLMVAMRDMLANIRFQEPPREDNPYRDDDEWD